MLQQSFCRHAHVFLLMQFPRVTIAFERQISKIKHVQLQGFLLMLRQTASHLQAAQQGI